MGMLSVLAVSFGDVAATWDSPSVIFFKLLAIGLLVLLNGFFVASEFAIVKVRSSQVDALVDQGNAKAIRTRDVLDHLDEYLSATQLGITLSSLGLGWMGGPFLAAVLEPAFSMLGITSPMAVLGFSFAIAFSIVTYLHIVFGELVPKTMAIRGALPVALNASGPLRCFYGIFRPAIWFLNGSANAFLRRVLKVEPVGESELSHSEEELRLILAESSSEDGEVSSLGNEILINALDMKRRVVRDIMTPRGDVIYLDLEESFDSELKSAIDSRHTRFPLCREHLDAAFGIVHIKDLLALVLSGKKDLESISRELLHVSEMMPLEKLLRFFLNKRAHLAVAVDEYGGAVGIVTLDNVIEELVGAIQDEFDSPEKELRHINENEFEVDGTHALYELEDALDHQFEDLDVTTIGGYVTSELGHLPVKGESVRIADWLATVLEADPRRVLRVHLKLDPVEKPDS